MNDVPTTKNQWTAWLLRQILPLLIGGIAGYFIGRATGAILGF